MKKLKFEDTIRRFGIDRLLLDTGSVIVGFSGGADSSCLLYHMNLFCHDNNIRLAAAHLNHGIRGKEADRDEMFARETCGRLGIKLYVRKLDIPSLSSDMGTGLEETARIERYRFFDDTANDFAGDGRRSLIATAHNADDNAETVLFNLIRGTGLHGLCGIEPVRKDGIIRPLIEDSGEDIREWCRENSISYVFDSTNAETDCTRNIIRLELIPKIKELNGSFTDSVSRMTALVSDDNRFIDEFADRLTPSDGTSVKRDVINSSDKVVSSRILRTLYRRTAPAHPTLREKHVADIIMLSETSDGESYVSLPESCECVIDRKNITFRRKCDALSENISFVYPGDGDVYTASHFRLTFSHGNHRLHMETQKSGENINNLSISVSLCSDKINGVLRVRNRKTGDTYFFGGMTRKVKKLLTDRHMTQNEKACLPIIEDDDGIVWIPGFPPRDGLKSSGPDSITITYCKQ